MPLGELWESLKGTLKTRSKSSFWGAFIVAWCVINWKYFFVTLVLTTDEVPYTDLSPHHDKLTYLINEVSWTWTRLLLKPAAAAFCVPLLLAFADELLAFLVQAIQRLWVTIRTKLNPKITPEPLVKAEAGINKLVKLNQTLSSEANVAAAELVELRNDHDQLQRAHKAVIAERDKYVERTKDLETNKARWQVYQEFARDLPELLNQLNMLQTPHAVGIAQEALGRLLRESLRADPDLKK